ncbi:hypothetical protein J2754_001688 [Halarchaeum solikamskense]|uniref:DUF2240 family protein n=1 Tax=Halarchaeum nitratireducens TaxID=489913 RepID=UPI001B3ADEF8|nr:DUF2240 family protein [Halarchaeum solikamskense]MBP2251363.1 hypothetical protein [Halarchaeum solikamskense]
MSLRVAVGAPFVSEGRDRLGEHEFVVALSLDRDWMSPDQAKRLVDVATGEGLLERDEGDLVAAFDLDAVTISEEFSPDESLFQERSAFETALDAVVSAGADRQETVAAVNALQRDFGVTADVAAVLHARREGVDVAAAARKAGEDL